MTGYAVRVCWICGAPCAEERELYAESVTPGVYDCT